MGDTDGSWGAEPHQDHPALCSSHWLSTLKSLQSPVDHIPHPLSPSPPTWVLRWVGGGNTTCCGWVSPTSPTLWPPHGDDPSSDARPATKPLPPLPRPAPCKGSYSRGDHVGSLPPWSGSALPSPVARRRLCGRWPDPAGWLPLPWQGQMLRKSQPCDIRALHRSSCSVPRSAGDELHIPSEPPAPHGEVTLPAHG